MNPGRDLAHMNYTGGTTGVSKAVMLTHRNVVANVIGSTCWTRSGRPVMRNGILYLEDKYQDPPGAPQEFVRVEGKEIIVNVAPFFHNLGLLTYLNGSILAGSTTILPLRFEPKAYMDAVEKYQATFVGAAPPLFLSLANTPGVEKRNLQSVTAVASGAAPMPVELTKRMQDIFPNLTIVLEAYGLTEVTCLATCNPAGRSGLRKIGTVGIPIYDTDVKIVDVETGDMVQPLGQEGEICIKGPQVMVGYFNRPEETSEVLRDGWLYTGDIGIMDEGGYIRIVDRKKDMLLYKGYNVYPKELEELLFQHQAVANCAVIGVKDELAGEFPKAFVVKRPAVEVSAQELMDYVNSQVVFYKKIRELEFIPEIPVSPVGKVLKRVLREREKERRKDLQ
jgi:long-chain acyl-CoA synthetase